MKITAGIFLFVLSASISTTAQTIDSTIARYAKDFGQERAYLQYDKVAYAPGDTAWFKAYLMKGIAPADDSRTFYVDWTDDRGNLLQHAVYPIVDATCNGQFGIPAAYTGKFIHVKAYTKWMLNFDSAFLYEKDLRVITIKPNVLAGNIAAVAELQFFPEGGDAITGVANKIAFKANDQWGRPLKIRGIVENQKGEKVDSLRVMHDGMGFFLLTPWAGESFIAKWKDEKGGEHVTPLPPVKPTGVSLQVTVSGTKREFIVRAEPGIAKDIGVLNIVGTINQFQAFKITRDFSPGILKGIIPTQDLPSGILTITVFDSKWKPLAERITYINNDEFRFKADLSVERWGLNKRARNEIVLSVPDSLSASFAVSVTDAGIESDSSDNIISHLLLTGDLKGQVYNPAYYFSDNSDAMAQRLDLVMLTHGWRRFNWDAVVKNKFPAILYPKDTSYLSLSGKVYGGLPGQLSNEIIIMVITQKGSGDGNKMILLGVEPDGTFNDPGYFLFDTAKIYYQLPKISDASVNFMESRLPALRQRMPASGVFYNQVGDTTGNARHFQLSDETLQLLKQLEGKTLENVIVKTKVKSPLEIMDEKYASGMFSGDSYKFDLVNDKTAFASNNIFQYLQAKVAGLVINTNTNPPSLLWRGGPPQLFLDEVQVEANFVSSISVSQIAYIKVFRPGSFAGTGMSSNGSIAIYMRKGGDVQPDQQEKGLNSSVVTGYTPIRQFYAPNYGVLNVKNEKQDLRTTLYWNPEIKTTPLKNKVKLVFYNNDVSKAFRVVIEGMTKDGQLVRLEQIMD